MRLMKSGRVKKVDIKVENNNGSSYYINNQGLKKLDFIDSTISFNGNVRNKSIIFSLIPAIFSIKYSNSGYNSTVYIVSNDFNDMIVKLDSLAKVKEFIANNIVC